MCHNNKDQHYSQPVGCRVRCSQTTFQKNRKHHSLPVGHGMKCGETTWKKQGWCHSQSVYHGMGWDQTSYGRKGGITHNLLIIGWVTMTPPGNVSLTTCCSWDEKILSGRRKRQCYSQASGDEIWYFCLIENNGSITHNLLLVIGSWHMMTFPGRNKWMLSLTICWAWDKQCDETALQKNRATHSLLIMGWDGMGWDCLV